MNQLRYMSVFAHVVEQGSITAAAEHLQLSKSVISQHLKGLEDELGVVLLKRTTRRQSLTAAGKTFYASCRELNNVADLAWQAARDTLVEPQGTVRITASDALMGALVAPAIASILRQHPKLDVELISNDQQVAIASGDIDLAIRVGASETSNLKQRRIGGFRDVLCAAPELLAQSVDQQSLYIANVWQGKDIQHHFQSKQTDECFDFTPNRQCKVDSFYTSIALMKEGAGIGLVPDFLLRESTDALVEVFEQFQLAPNPVYVLHPYNHSLPLSVSVCLQAIEGKLSEVI